MRPPILASEAEQLGIKNKMEAILAQLKQGHPFETMVRDCSEASLHCGGGELGLFGLDELSPQIREALTMLDAGAFTAVLDTDQGYQIFYVAEIVKTPGKPLEEVSAEIQEKIFQERVDTKFTAWLTDLRNRSHIKIIQ